MVLWFACPHEGDAPLPTIDHGQSLEAELRTLLRLRSKHAVTSDEAKSYRRAIIEQLGRVRAFRRARQANSDLLLPHQRKKRFSQSRMIEPSSS